MSGKEKREHWGSSFGFIMAAAGSAIGLGNIWKFPYITGMNGGGAFVLVYLCCILLIGLPIMLAELALGRASQSDPIGAFRYFAPKSKLLTRTVAGLGTLLALGLFLNGSYGHGSVIFAISVAIAIWGWAVAGFFCTFVAVWILSYYAIIGGWILIYAGSAFTGKLNFSSVDEATLLFGNIASNGMLNILLTAIFLGMCALVCFFGVKKGIEGVSKVMMPLLLILILVLIARSLTLPGASKGVRFFLSPDFSKITAAGVLEALGHAFYSLSLGMGVLITYGSYLSKKRNIFQSAVVIASLDTAIALLAGLAIFPAVFAMGMNPGAGPSLIFNILPVTFNAIPGNFGWLWNGLFFSLMIIAALTSGICLLEAGTASCMEHLKMKRGVAVFWVTFGVFCSSLVISYGVTSWQKFPDVQQLLLRWFGPLKSSVFDQVDYICSNWMLPLNGLAVALFVSWIWGVGKAGKELYRRGYEFTEPTGEMPRWKQIFNLKSLVGYWAFFIRTIAPLLVLVTFLYAVGLFAKLLPC